MIAFNIMSEIGSQILDSDEPVYPEHAGLNSQLGVTSPLLDR